MTAQFLFGDQSQSINTVTPFFAWFSLHPNLMGPLLCPSIEVFFPWLEVKILSFKFE